MNAALGKEHVFNLIATFKRVVQNAFHPKTLLHYTDQINTNSEPLTQSEIERLKEQARIISQTLETNGE